MRPRSSASKAPLPGRWRTGTGRKVVIFDSRGARRTRLVSTRAAKATAAVWHVWTLAKAASRRTFGRMAGASAADPRRGSSLLPRPAAGCVAWRVTGAPLPVALGDHADVGAPQLLFLGQLRSLEHDAAASRRHGSSLAASAARARPRPRDSTRAVSSRPGPPERKAGIDCVPSPRRPAPGSLGGPPGPWLAGSQASCPGQLNGGRQMIGPLRRPRPRIKRQLERPVKDSVSSPRTGWKKRPSRAGTM